MDNLFAFDETLQYRTSVHCTIPNGNGTKTKAVKIKNSGRHLLPLHSQVLHFVTLSDFLFYFELNIIIILCALCQAIQPFLVYFVSVPSVFVSSGVSLCFTIPFLRFVVILVRNRH